MSQSRIDLHSRGTNSWIVQKYGGTSVGKFAGSIAAIVRRDSGTHRVAVVCSARSSGLKSEGTTSKLLQAAAEAEHGDSAAFRSIVNSIRDDHAQAAKAEIASPSILKDLGLRFQIIFQDLLSVLVAASTLGEVSPRTLDIAVGIGEILSCQFMTAVLQDRGVDAQLVDFSNIKLAEAHYSGDQALYTAYATAIYHQILACGSRIPIITGFFGPVPGGLLGRVGRGYTDLCAALVAISVTASELQIWKEVDGVFSADPRKVPTARLLSTITPSEAAELTFYGSEVIHPFTMEQVIREHIPIRIKNVNNPRGTGTIILPTPISTLSTNGKVDAASTPVTFRPRKSVRSLTNRRFKHPTAVTTKNNILVINVHSSKKFLSYGFFANVFSILDKWRLSVDLISSSQVHISMAFHFERGLARGDDDRNEVTHADLQGALAELADLGAVELADGMAIVSLVGQEMKNMVGVSGKMLRALGENGINVEMISQGASEINISCVVEERQADRAVEIIHTDLLTPFE